MTFNRESSLHNSFYSFSNYGWNSTKYQPVGVRAAAKIKYFRIERIKQDTYMMKLECLMFALYFSFMWGGHQNVLGLSLISIWKKVNIQKNKYLGNNPYKPARRWRLWLDSFTCTGPGGTLRGTAVCDIGLQPQEWDGLKKANELSLNHFKETWIVVQRNVFIMRLMGLGQSPNSNVHLLDSISTFFRLRNIWFCSSICTAFIIQLLSFFLSLKNLLTRSTCRKPF